MATTMSTSSRHTNKKGVTPPCDPSVLASARTCVSSCELHVEKGIPFKGHGEVGDFEEMFRQISNLKLESNTVLMDGFPRSGSHWVFEILNMIFQGTCEFGDRNCGDGFLDLSGSNVTGMYAALPKPKIITTHLHPGLLPRDICKVSTKLVYILRNPKDALVSWYRVTSSYVRDQERFSGSWEEFFEIQVCSCGNH